MRTRLLSILLGIGLAAGFALASAKTYAIDLFQPVMLGSTELKPGHYTIAIDGAKAVLRNGKLEGEASVKMEDADRKYDRTSVVLLNSGGQMHIQEIHIGGSKTKLVFTE
ncbi:MAG TPA: hypothetical protein VKV17_06465 [Bryobacteraceae bacterium]|nr:hypothetical protein [Bryobacteraceae bacterium]